VLLAGGSSRVPLVGQMVTEEFGKPVHVTLHPKFTVALGAAAISGRASPSTPPGGMPVAVTPAIGMPQQALPMSPPGGIPVAARRKKWLVPAIAAAVVVISAAVTTVVLTSGEPTQAGQQAEPRANTGTSTPTTTTTTPAASSGTAANAPATPPPPTHSATTKAAPPVSTAPPTLWVYNNSAPVSPFHSLIASSDNWSGVDFGAAGARQTPIAAAPDGAGLRVTWKGGSPAEIYLQDVATVRDFTSYVDNGGALVFDTVVHTPPADVTTIGVHCKYPCASSVLATTLFRTMPTGQKTTVKIPLNCFTARGLNAERVDTPFLVYTGGAFDATFSAVRWETNVKDAIPCDGLS
jgi:molecular chaperone DnaK